ncbi:hypothetical protein WDW86_12915 [Bdellovibrionota bacterium FG-2]
MRKMIPAPTEAEYVKNTIESHIDDPDPLIRRLAQETLAKTNSGGGCLEAALGGLL